MRARTLKLIRDNSGQGFCIVSKLIRISVPNYPELIRVSRKLKG